MSTRSLVSGLLVSFILLAAGAGASEYSTLLSEAAQAIDGDFKDDWAFTETSVEAKTSTVARFNPSRSDEDHWQLLSVDGRDPTEKEISEFVKNKSEEATRRDANEQDDSENGVETMVAADSLKLIEESSSHWLFSFVPEGDGDDDAFMKHVDGTLRIAKAGPYIEYVDMQSTRPFKPQTGVKINEFLTRLSFGPAVTGGPIVPVAVDIKIKARAFVVKKIEEATSITFTEFEYVGD